MCQALCDGVFICWSFSCSAVVGLVFCLFVFIFVHIYIFLCFVLSSSSSAFLAISLGLTFFSEIFAHVTVFESNHRGRHMSFAPYEVHAVCAFVCIEIIRRIFSFLQADGGL